MRAAAGIDLRIPVMIGLGATENGGNVGFTVSYTLAQFTMAMENPPIIASFLQFFYKLG